MARAIIARGGTAIVPIRKNGRPWKEDCPAALACNETLRATRHYGRAFWKRWTGDHTRSRAEAKMRGLKSFGERIAAVRRCPRTMYGWLPRGKGFLVDAGVISVAAM